MGHGPPAVRTGAHLQALGSGLPVPAEYPSRRCYALLTKHRGLMDEMTERLIAEETIDYTDLEKMRDEHLKTLEAAPAAEPAA